jgi:cathepsin H
MHTHTHTHACMRIKEYYVFCLRFKTFDLTPFFSSHKRFFHNSSQTPPHAVDWRTKGIITPIKNQKQCGSCWTFSTTGCLEAHTCLAHGKDCTAWTGLAEQQLLDCATPYNNHGCNGGLPSQAYEYIKYAGGIDSEDSYPYQANDTDGCRDSGGGDSNSNNNSHGRAAQVAEVFNITSYDEVDLVQAIQYVGPVSIAYQVSADFRFYAHGVYDSYNATTNSTMCKSSPMDVNHAVVAVGIGSTQEGTPFYIVRNSWSTSWGMEGYFWMLRGRNLCGVSDCASFPLVPAATSTTNTNNTMKVVEQHPPVFHLRQKEASTTG